jgi:hypothetical protein
MLFNPCHLSEVELHYFLSAKTPAATPSADLCEFRNLSPLLPHREKRRQNISRRSCRSSFCSVTVQPVTFREMAKRYKFSKSFILFPMPTNFFI